MRSLSGIFVVVFVVVGCESTAARKIEGEQRRAFAAAVKVEAEQEAAAVRATSAQKAVEEKAASVKLADLRSDVRAHPGKYLVFSGTGYSTWGMIHGDRQLVRVSASNRSPFELSIEGAHVTAVHNSDGAVTFAPLSLNGTVRTGESIHFRTPTSSPTTLSDTTRNVRVNVDTVEIVDVAKMEPANGWAIRMIERYF